MASKGLFVMSMIVLLITTLSFPYTCHARFLKGFVLSNENNVLVATASDPGLNLALPTQIFEVSGSDERASGSVGGRGGGDARYGTLDVEDEYKKDKYMKFRALVLAALPKGTKKSPSGPSKRHNDFNA